MPWTCKYPKHGTEAVFSHDQFLPSLPNPLRNSGHTLEEALRLNRPLAIAYYLKDDLRRFWEQDDFVSAFNFLDDWCARAQASRIRILEKFAKTLLGHRSGLLAWYHHPISTGPLEGVNNKIKLMQRRAYGYRDLELFRLRIYSLHETRFELVG
jgi:transposase